MELSGHSEREQEFSLGRSLFRYGFAVLMFAAVIGLSLLLTYLNFELNLTIPIIFALVAVAWFGGRGPGLLISVLSQATTIIYTPIPPESTVGQAWFWHFGMFSLYIFLVLIISDLHRVQRRLAEQRDLLRITLSSIGDAVIATDKRGFVTFMNPVAQELTGWREEEAQGSPLDNILRIFNEETREVVTNPVTQVLATGARVALANHSMLLSRNGNEIPIDDSAAPIADAGKIKGVILVFSDITERKMAERSRRESEIMQRIVEAQESERNRIARDLHDHLGQRMTALRFKIESFSALCMDHPVLSEEMVKVQTDASRIDRDIGFLSWELRPTELDQLGLENALSSFVHEWAKQYGVAAEFHSVGTDFAPPSDRLSLTAQTNLYRIAQEGLHNILKHANAKNVSVLLHQREDRLVLIMDDDGSGFDQEITGAMPQLGRGLGLVGMHERTTLLNGTLEIESKLGEGTTILASIPF